MCGHIAQASSDHAHQDTHAIRSRLVNAFEASADDGSEQHETQVASTQSSARPGDDRFDRIELHVLRLDVWHRVGGTIDVEAPIGYYSFGTYFLGLEFQCRGEWRFSVTRIQHPRRLHLLAIGVVLAVTSACGSSGSNAQPEALPTTAAAPTPTTPTPVTTPAGPSTTATVSSTPGLPVIADGELRYLWTIFSEAGGGVVVTRLDGTDPLRLAADVPGVLKHASWAPDGKQVVFVDETTEKVWIAHLDGSPSEQVPGCDGNGCDYPAFSPDGSRLAYSRSENGDGFVGPAAVGIEVIDLKSGKVTKVVRLERPLLADVPRWSPDGTQIVFGVDQMDSSAVETGDAIAIVSATGGEPTYLTKFSLFGYKPDWNLSTGEIVFGTVLREFAADFRKDETWNAWGVKSDGTGLRQITRGRAGEKIKGPKWTPDGSAILAFSTFKGMVSIDPATGTMTRITGVPAHSGSPHLRPMPRPSCWLDGER